jgi:uncharacterized membrane-anchored protein
MTEPLKLDYLWGAFCILVGRISSSEADWRAEVATKNFDASRIQASFIQFARSGASMGIRADAVDSKVPQATLVFWILKIAATTLGETGGDAVTMSMDLGYLIGTAIFAVIFVLAVSVQIASKRFHPFLYWAVIVATTTTGTTLADLADRSLGIGYAGGSAFLLVLLLLSFVCWYWTTGSVAINTVATPRAEAFYWITILFSQTLGTALGDWTADDAGLGYGGSALLFIAAIAIVAAAYLWTKVSQTVLFWSAFVLTRPLGATVGDFLDKPHAEGGLALSRYAASAVLIVFMIAALLLLPQKAEPRVVKEHPS